MVVSMKEVGVCASVLAVVVSEKCVLDPDYKRAHRGCTAHLPSPVAQLS